MITMKENMIKRFNKVNGYYIDKIYGQERFGYAISDTEDFYDMIEFMKRDGYKGSVILFYDHETGEVYQPFDREENVIYGKPLYTDGFFYFLQGCFVKNKDIWEKERSVDKHENVRVCHHLDRSELANKGSNDPEDIPNRKWNDNPEGTIRLFQYTPGETPKIITGLSAKEVELYNLMLLGDKIHIISEDSVFECYYPEKIRIPLQSNESVDMILNDRIYINAWIEEGWDKENDRATKDYNYYNKIIIKDLKGNTVSEEIGCLQQASDGSWWIA